MIKDHMIDAARNAMLEPTAPTKVEVDRKEFLALMENVISINAKLVELTALLKLLNDANQFRTWPIFSSLPEMNDFISFGALSVGVPPTTTLIGGQTLFEPFRLSTPSSKE